MVSIILISALFLLTLAALAFVALVFVSLLASSLAGAPYIGMRNQYIDALLSLGGVSVEDVVCDLGCGDGRVLIAALERRRARRAVGYEISLWPFLKVVLKRYFSRFRSRLEVRRKNLLEADLSEVTIVYMYLYPLLVQRAALKINESARPGTRVVSVHYSVDLEAVPNFRLLKTAQLGSMTAYVYEIARY
ncbi:MAG TPA: hypothetical protein VEB60_02840 [Candidatus Paceibacterota bacterium]|nr:hypothetical protein [Candidatus Paceibacterota bacterium]